MDMNFHVFDTYVKSNDCHTIHFDVITDKNDKELVDFNGINHIVFAGIRES